MPYPESAEKQSMDALDEGHISLMPLSHPLSKVESADHAMVEPLTAILDGEVGSVTRGSKQSGPALFLD